MPSPRIVLLHATPVAIPPITAAFATDWPEAETVNLLDDSLSQDRARETALTPEIIQRFVALGRYAHSTGANGILVTCSAFGPAIEQLSAALPIPVIKPNEAMFADALKAGSRIGMLATFQPSIGTMETEFAEYIEAEKSNATLTTILVEGAMDRLRAGDVESHNRLIACRAPELSGMDAVMLAHFSTSSAVDAVSRTIRCPVLAAPQVAVRRMKKAVGS